MLTKTRLVSRLQYFKVEPGSWPVKCDELLLLFQLSYCIYFLLAVTVFPDYSSIGNNGG